MVRSSEDLVHGLRMRVYHSWLASNGFRVILGTEPISMPFKLVTSDAGMAHFNLCLFILAFAITRSGRFFLEAWILKTWGPAMLEIVEKRLALWVTIGIVVLVGGFLALKLLH